MYKKEGIHDSYCCTKGIQFSSGGEISLQKRLGKTRVTLRVSVRKNAFYKTTKSCLIKGLITLSYNVYTFWMDTVFFLSFFLSFFFFFLFFCFVFCFLFLFLFSSFFFVFVFCFCFCFLFCFLFLFLFFCFSIFIALLKREPPATFFILSYTCQIYMHNDNNQYSFFETYHS